MSDSIQKRILYEDNHLIAINKLAGELSQSDNTGDVSLENLAKSYIREKYAKPGNVFLHAVHRLDRPVSGVLLCARTGKALERLTAQLREREIKKTYWALVAGKPPKIQDALVHFLKRLETKNITRVVRSAEPGAKESRLRYKILKSAGKYYLLEVLPETGRHHQIRVQLAALGCPIAGDVKYGYPQPLPDASIALHARKLEFPHPVKKENICITAPLPATSIWNVAK